MPREPQIVVVGSHGPGYFVRVERPPLAGETVIGWDYEEPVDGAKGSNQAIAAARLGARVSFVGCVGADRLGQLGESWLRDAGVDTTFLTYSAEKATVGGFVMLDRHGVPAIVSLMGANGDLTAQHVVKALRRMQGARLLLTQLEIPLPVALEALRVAHKLRMTTVLNPSPVLAGLPRRLPAVDILVANESEAFALLQIDPRTASISEAPEATHYARRLHKMTGVGCVVITLGEHGLVACDDDGVWHISAPAVSTVDTTGAGDAFCGALAAELVEGVPIRDATQRACVVAAYTVTQRGTIPVFPTQAQVSQFAHKLQLL